MRACAHPAPGPARADTAPPPNRASHPNRHQYTRYPPIDSRNGKVVVDAAAVSADKKVYTNPKYPTLIVTGAPCDIEVNPKGCDEPNNYYCSGNYGYGWAQVLNRTHFHWKWNTTVPVKGSADPTFSDELWIVKQ